MKNILLVRTDKIGDLVLATPCIRAAKEQWPEAKVTFLAHRYAVPLLEGNPFLDETLLYPDNSLTEKLKSGGFDVAVDLWSTFHVAWSLYRSGIPLRVASGFRWHQFLFNRRVYLRRSLCRKKEWEYNLDLMKLIGWDGSYLTPELYIKVDEIRWAEEMGMRQGWKTPLVCLYPGGGDEIGWPPHHFKELNTLLIKEGFNVVVFWGPGELDLAKEVAGEKGKVSPPTSIRELMALMSLCDAVISNNTGPMHIAAALNKPLVQIFDPRWSCNPKRWGHYGSRFKVLIPPVDHCKRCSEHCKFYNCMTLISPQQVLKSLREVLSTGE